MEIRTEYHTTQKTLFRRVNQIRRANGICDFEEHKTGYRLRYCDSTDIANGFLVLNGKDKSGAGYVHDGSLSDMLKVGLTASTEYQKSPFIALSGEAIELPFEMVDDGIDTPVRYLFKVLEQIVAKSTLKDALDNVWTIGHHSNRRECNSIRTHHVMRLPGAAISHELPQLRFGGHWLERAGFDAGQEVKIITINGMILIVPVQPPVDLPKGS